MLEQTVSLRVPPERVAELAAFSGSLLVDRTRGELSSRCDSEEANFAAINLTYEILEHIKDPLEARQQYAETIMQGSHPEYQSGLMFLLPIAKQAMEDEPYRFR